MFILSFSTFLPTSNFAIFIVVPEGTPRSLQNIKVKCRTEIRDTRTTTSTRKQTQQYIC